jgi:hypothetical protein
VVEHRKGTVANLVVRRDTWENLQRKDIQSKIDLRARNSSYLAG